MRYLMPAILLIAFLGGCAAAPSRSTCGAGHDGNSSPCQDSYQRRADTEPRGPGR
jgi:hypothetical protein